MSWDLHHTESERLAQAAQATVTAGDQQRARDLYLQAAESEERALAELDAAKLRTRGITAVSVLSLWLKSGRVETVRRRGEELLRDESLPHFARTQIHEILQAGESRRSPQRLYEVEITFRQTLRYAVNAQSRRAAEQEALSRWKLGDDSAMLGSDVCELVEVQAHGTPEPGTRDRD